MEFLRKPVRRCIGQSLTTLAAAFLIASISGCASPGPARPPSLHLPRLVSDLSATRTGDSVTLHWITPEKTTDGLKVQPPLTAEICREAPGAKPSHRAAACTSVLRLAVNAGASETSETLPASLTAEPATLLTYRVQIFNAKGHSAGLSSPAFAAAGAAPPPIENLRATAIREGAMLEWQPQPTQALVELDRVLVQAAPPARKPPAKQPKEPLHLTSAAPAEIHLQAGKPASDPGGTIDPTAQRGETYRYTAQRVRSVVISGHDLRLGSTRSPVVTLVMRDIFPPKAPASLVAAPSAESIDLSWEPNTEPDLAGYLVYRQPIDSTGTPVGASARLTPAPIPVPAFSDHTAQTGQTWSYHVTAVDTGGNESPSSNQTQESRRNP